MKKQPEQTKKTRQKLMDAFYSIYQEKSIDKISISEITKISNYNRSTFYEYFTDIYDLLDQFEDELLEQIRLEMTTTFAAGIPSTISEYSLRCAAIFKKYDDRVFLLLSQNGVSNFYSKLQQVFFSTFRSIANCPDNIPHIDYMITFIFSSLTGILTHWYETGKELPEEELVFIFQKLLTSGIIGYTNFNIFQESTKKVPQ